ncbi:MAG: hypothetical protein JO362_00905 [Streptomycetaceae bacterium]|nr:hypothetical protein [Streptomycetaceae bacterium]
MAAKTPASLRTAWAEAADRIRAASSTEPGRLRIIGAALVTLILAFGAVTAWQIAERSSAAQSVTSSSEPLSVDAAEIYRSLADANTTEAGGFLAGGVEPSAVRRRYQNDINTAAQLIAEAAANSQGSSAGQNQMQLLGNQLPVYNGLVETARADNRQGLPLGGAYLRYANEQMSGTLLPAAQKLYQLQTGRLRQDYSSAESLPWGTWALGALVLGALVWAQRRTYRRTHRVFNPGMLAGTVAVGVLLLWLVVAHTVAREDLADSWDHGAKSMQVLNQARIDSLQARGNENLTLVARGTDTSYEDSYQQEMATLDGPRSGTAPGGLLAQALSLADDSAGRSPVQAAVDDVVQWRSRHDVANRADTAGDYDTAVADVIGGTDTSGMRVTAASGQSFDSVDSSLQRAITHEGIEFQQASGDGRKALTGLSVGAAVLALLGAAGSVLGIGRRLSEYR